MSKDTTIGLHGHLILGLLYVFGALTQPQLVRLSGLHISTVKKQIGHLVRAGYVARALDVAGWRPKGATVRSGYYLTSPKGVDVAANALGTENDFLARRSYKRVRVPGTISHRLLGSESLIVLLEAVRAREKSASAGREGEAGAEEKREPLDVEGVHAESCSDFPVFGKGVPKSGRADSPWRYTRIVPDGLFTLDGATYYLEIETGSHARKDLAKKLSDYASRWRRMLRPAGDEKKYHDRHARLEPVVIITPSADHKRMRDYLREHLPVAEDWKEAAKAITEASGGRAEPGQLIIVAGIDEVREDPLGRVYRPLFRYPPECSGPSPSGVSGWRVSLADAAAISGRIPIPERAPKLEKKKPSGEKPLGEEEVA